MVDPQIFHHQLTDQTIYKEGTMQLNKYSETYVIKLTNFGEVTLSTGLFVLDFSGRKLLI